MVIQGAVGKAIEEWRRARGWNLTELAQATGMKPPEISQLETGRRNMSPMVALKMEGPMKGSWANLPDTNFNVVQELFGDADISDGITAEQWMMLHIREELKHLREEGF